MHNCLNKRIKHETFKNEPSLFEEELPQRHQGAQEKPQANSNERRRKTLKTKDGSIINLGAAIKLLEDTIRDMEE